MTYVYSLGCRHDLPLDDVRMLIGGKATNLAVMSNELALPVPPGFVVTTEACRAVLADGWPEGLDAEMGLHMRIVEEAVGRRFGDHYRPLLVSVRSGAPVSMPGMMDTVLNLGLNDTTEAGLAMASGDPTFAADCRRRLARMFTDVVGTPVPDDPWQQLREAVEAVFRSWNSARAQLYRKREGIPDDLGTAAIVQAMVFGNFDASSCTGVVFTRDPSTGEPVLYGDVVFGGQGEDVVAGTHHTEPVAALAERLPEVAAELGQMARALEHHFSELCEIEFTVEAGKLWFLQVRRGKSSVPAALRMAVDMAREEDFPLSKEQAVRRVARYLRRPPLQRSVVSGQRALAKGMAASPGLASGEIVTSRDEAASVAAAGRPLILVRVETSPEDVPAMSVAAGIITARGGLTSHAAVIARDWGIPAVIGAPVEIEGQAVVIGGCRLAVGAQVSIDGSTGEIFAGVVEGSSRIAPEVQTLLAWAKEFRLGIDDVPPSGVPPPVAEVKVAVVLPVDVLRVLAIKEASSVTALAAAVLSEPRVVEQLVDQLARQGLVKLDRGMVSLAETGRQQGRQLFAADAERWGRANAVAALDAFQGLDARVKATVTAWQLRDTDGALVPNDHSDKIYDRAVLEDLASLHADVMRWLDPLAPGLGRLSTYGQRLSRALKFATEGDYRFIASPRVDSYHTVWFELHEDLIRLSGRTREQEIEAGRA